MNVLDILILIFVVFFFIKGMLQGLLFSLIKFFAYILGIVVAVNFSAWLSRYLFSDSGGVGAMLFPLLSYVIIFVIVVWAVHLLGKWLGRKISVVGLSGINRLAGGVLYMLIASMAISVVLWMLNRMDVLNPQTKAESLLFYRLEPLVPIVFDAVGALLPFLKNTFDSLNHFFKNLAEGLGTNTAYVDFNRQ